MTSVEYNDCVDKYADNVYRFVLKNINDKDTAKDIIQDSFIKMWNNVKNITTEKAKSYLFTTAYHTMIDVIRKNKKEVSLADASYYNYSTNEQYSDLKEILDEAINKLSDIQRTVILLRDYEGYSYDEIGKIVELNESQVKVYIYRARTFLKKYIGSVETVI